LKAKETGLNTMPKILLVEDDEANYDMLSRRLTRRGYEVILAHDGVSGVKMAESAKPDLILMDMNLPEMDGWTATRTIRQIPEIKDVPIIALTAHAITGDRERCIEAGCNDYDSKPVDFPRLLSRIEKYVGTPS
jgi:two-component system, cell cycle response regulator DivK